MDKIVIRLTENQIREHKDFLNKVFTPNIKSEIYLTGDLDGENIDLNIRIVKH